MVHDSKSRFVLRVLVAFVSISTASRADLVMTPPDGNAPWLGYMNVFELPANGGGFAFGSGWGVADLVATFETPPDPTVTLRPNSIGDPDPFWYIGGGGPGAPGNKIMEANLYLEETGPWSGETVVFKGFVTAFSLTSEHETRAFIKDFASDYSWVSEAYLPLTGTGPFSLSLATIDDLTRHVQIGFQTKGVDVWATDIGPYGSITVSAIPEPGSLAFLVLGTLGVGLLRGRRIF